MKITEARLVEWRDVPKLESEGWRIPETELERPRVGHEYGPLMIREYESVA